MSESGGKTTTGLQQNIEALLCYLGTWITGIVFFIIEKENKFVRFHAMQSIITFGAIFIIMAVMSVIPFIGWMINYILGIVVVILWIFCMLKAYQGQMFKLPIVGEIAEKQVK